MAREKRKIDILDPKADPVKLILALVWPMIIEEILSIMVNFVDTAMVGSIGVNATASVAVSNPAIEVCNGVAIGLGSGFGVMMSRRIGEGRKDLALKTMRQSVYYIVAMGGFMTLLFSWVLADHLPQWMNAQPDIWDTSSVYLRYFGYSRAFIVAAVVGNSFLRGQGHTREAMMGNVIANLTNCVLNFLFIYPTRMLTVFGVTFKMWGLGQGVAGAAIASSIANFAMCVYVVWRLFDKNLVVPFSLGKLEKVDKELYRFSFSLGAPNAFERLVSSSGRMVCTSLLAGISNVVLSSHQLAGTAESIIFMSVMGFGMTGTTLVSQWLGAGNKDRAKLLAHETLKLAFIVGTIATLIVFFFCPNIVGFFTPSREVVKMATLALRIQCIIEPLEALTMATGGVLRGAGDVRISAFTSLIGMWGIRVPGAFILIKFFGWGLLGVWVPMAIEWFLRFLILYGRYRKGNWVNAWGRKKMAN